jgi:hypothetical protein
VARETSAHVGRVATRLGISTVLATKSIIAGASRSLRLRLGYSRLGSVALPVSRDQFPAREKFTVI